MRHRPDCKCVAPDIAPSLACERYNEHMRAKADTPKAAKETDVPKPVEQALATQVIRTKTACTKRFCSGCDCGAESGDKK